MMDITLVRTFFAVLVFSPYAAAAPDFLIPFQLFPLSNDSIVYDVRENEARGTMHGRTFVDGPVDIPYPAFHLTGSTFVDIDFRAPSSSKFSFASLVYFESTETGVLYEYKDNESRLVFRVWIETGYLLMRSFEGDGTAKLTLKAGNAQIPQGSWFQITINIDKTNGKVQVWKQDFSLMNTAESYLPLLGTLTPGSLRVGSSLSNPKDCVKGRVTCLRVYDGWPMPSQLADLRLDCDYKANFPFPFSGPYGCMYSPCQNGGTCTDKKTMEHTCTCLDGFTGVNCETDIDECANVPCLNGGTCADVINGYTCTCSSGFTGSNCQIDINECRSDPCLNDGTCQDGIDSYSCSCSEGYTGSRCETDIDECASDPCLNGGECSEEIDSYTCTCLNGYTGIDCQTDIDDCSGAPCLNGGTCEDGVNRYFCVCPTGFTGRHCEKVGPGHYHTGYFHRNAADGKPSNLAEIATVMVSSVHRCGSQCMRKTRCLSFTTKMVSSTDLVCKLYGDVDSSLVASPKTRYYIPKQ